MKTKIILIVLIIIASAGIVYISTLRNKVNDNKIYEQIVPGDINQDQQIDIQDLTMLSDLLKKNKASDFDQNGVINAKDFDSLQTYLFGKK